MYRIASWVVLALILTACDSSVAPGEARIRGVNYIGVSVADVERSAAFYVGSVDLTRVKLSAQGSSAPILKLAGGGETALETRLLKSSNSQLRLMQFSPPSNQFDHTRPTPVNGPGIAHVCYQVNKETMAYDRFLAAGASPIGTSEMVQLNPRRPVEYAYVHDLDGIMFEVEHVDVEALELDTPPANDYRIRHVSLATPDMGAALAFYTRLLDGQKPRRAGRFFGLSGAKVDQVSGLPGSELEMAWFQVRNLELELVQYHSHPTARPAQPRPVDALGYNMIVFDVASMDDARALLQEAGGTLVSEPEAMDGGEILFGRDPDGNLLGFQRVDANAAVSSQNFKDNGI